MKNVHSAPAGGNSMSTGAGSMPGRRPLSSPGQPRSGRVPVRRLSTTCAIRRAVSRFERAPPIHSTDRFRHVTIPGLRPVMLFVFTTTILASANVFGQAFLITQGAPGEQTRTVVWRIVDEGLRDYDAGRAAAMSVFFALMLAVVSVVNFRLFRYRED